MDSIYEQIHSVHACMRSNGEIYKISSYHFSCAMIAHTQTQSNRLNQLHFGEEKRERHVFVPKTKQEGSSHAARSVDFVTVSVDGVYLLNSKLNLNGASALKHST